MFEKISEKRRSFAASKRKMLHERIFEINRQLMSQDMNVCALLSCFLRQKAYEQIEGILDRISLARDEQKVEEKMKTQIQYQESQNTDSSIRYLMLKLMNRLGLWKHEHVMKAIKLVVSEGEESMIKEIALYFEVILQQTPNKNSEQLLSAYNQIFSYKLKNQTLLVYWIDIVSQGFIRLNKKPLLEEMEGLFLILDDGLCTKDPFTVIRVLMILNKIVSDEKFGEKIIQMQGYPLILEFLKDGNYDFVISGLELLAQIFNSSDQILLKAVNKFDILSIMETYATHVFDQFRQKALWALSNIAGSELGYFILLENSSIMNSLTYLFYHEIKNNVSLQLRYLFLNLFCTCQAKHFEKIINQHSALQILLQIFDQISGVPFLKNALLERVLIASYNFISESDVAKLKLQERGIENKLEYLYQTERNQKNTSKIRILLETFHNS